MAIVFTFLFKKIKRINRLHDFGGFCLKICLRVHYRGGGKPPFFGNFSFQPMKKGDFKNMLTLNEIIEWNLTGEQIEQTKNKHPCRSCHCGKQQCCKLKKSSESESKK